MFEIEWNEDGSATVLGRITAAEGTGTATGVAGEGNWLKIVDVSTITCKVFDLDSATPDTPIATPTVTVASAVINTPVTSNALWTKDDVGYNFLHSLGAANFPTGGRRYQVEYTVTTAAGSVFHGVYTGIANPIRSS